MRTGNTRTAARTVLTLSAMAAALAIPPTAAAGASGSETFPKGFMWGVANAGFQTEMGGGSAYSDRNTDWWAWTHDPANIAAKKVSGDQPETGPGGWKTSFATDIALAKSLGLNTWRMGIEWSRIFPRSTGSVKIGSTVSTTNLRSLDRLANRTALTKYRAIITAARRAGLKPFVTLNHFTLPLWIHDPIQARDALAPRAPDDPVPASLTKAGWLSSTTVTEFRKYSAYLAWKLGDLVDWWAPLNEPMVVAVNGYANVPGAISGWFPPGAYSYRSAIRAVENMAAANAAAYDEIRTRDAKDTDGDGKRSKVGLVHNMIHFTPADPGSSNDTSGTAHANQIFNRMFPDAAIKGIIDRNANGRVDAGESDPKLAGKADFFGLNYYFRGRITGIGIPISRAIPLLDFLPKTGYSWALNPTGDPCPTLCSDFGNEIDVDGFGSVLREAGSYGKPIVITENGIADANDSMRRAFIVRHLDQAWKYSNLKVAGAPLIGWLHWSLTDNFEWSAGYRPKFGLYSFSPTTLARTARPSAATVSTIAKGNAIPGPLVDQYVNTDPNS